MKNDNTFVRMRSGDHLGDAKMSKKAPCSVEFNFFIIAIDRNGFGRTKEVGLMYKALPEFLIFAWGFSIFQSLVMFLPVFSTSKDHN